jgi:hypothetical protein
VSDAYTIFVQCASSRNRHPNVRIRAGQTRRQSGSSSDAYRCVNYTTSCTGMALLTQLTEISRQFDLFSIFRSFRVGPLVGKKRGNHIIFFLFELLARPLDLYRCLTNKEKAVKSHQSGCCLISVGWIAGSHCGPSS